MTLVSCVDFGSTYTKAVLVDVDAGSVVAAASHRTTIDSDVLDGWYAARAGLERLAPGAAEAPVLACSSAGGGLRIAVVGNEELVTAEAGRRVALSSGGRVVHVSSDRVDVGLLRESRPDVVLLVGGTDGGNAEVLLANARALARARWRSAVVVAGNAHASAEIGALLSARGVPHVVADNVVPRIGVLRPGPARTAIREMFVSHVIGGKRLSRGPDFGHMVRGATPDVVLSAVELLANGIDAEHPGAGDVVVVDVGGATTDVHSVIELDAEDRELGREVVAATPVSRTVEGDLGMRWSAPSTVAAGVEVDLTDAQGLEEAAARRYAEPGWVAASATDVRDDLALARIAVLLAVRRHGGRQRVVFGPDGRLVERSGKDLRRVGLLIGSGGVLRHARRGDALAVLAAATGDHVDGGWLLPRAPRLAVDTGCVLAAAGLLADTHPHAAYSLLAGLESASS